MIKATKPKRTRLVETVLNEELKSTAVDRENGIIKGVKILGRVSRNKREYSDKAMDDGVRLYEGLKVNVDHPDKANPKAERLFLEGFGELRNVHREAEGVFGDLHFLRKHPAAETVCEAAERFPKQFGLSHNAEGEVVTRSGRVVVESLTSAVSVDIVGRPATNEGIFESVDADETGGQVVKTSIRKLLESGKAKRFKVAAIPLVEMEGGDAALMDAPYEMEAPAEGEEADPDAAIADAFESAVVAVLRDASMDTAAKLARIEEILTAQETLATGKAPAAEAAPAADAAPVAESVSATALADMRKLIATQAVAVARQDARLMLMEGGREVNPERITALAEAKDDAHRTLLLESWPKKTVVAKPAVSRPLVESADVPAFPADSKSFLSAIKDRNNR